MKRKFGSLGNLRSYRVEVWAAFTSLSDEAHTFSTCVSPLDHCRFAFSSSERSQSTRKRDELAARTAAHPGRRLWARLLLAFSCKTRYFYPSCHQKRVISQLVVFAPQEAAGIRFAMEMHRINDTKETHIVLRRLPDEKD